MRVAALIASYKGEELTKKLVMKLKDIKEIKYIIIREQKCDFKKLEEIKKLSNKIHINHQGVPHLGKARKSLYLYANLLHITHALTLDNDINLTKRNFEEFFIIAKKNPHNLISIDLTDYYTKNQYNILTWHYSNVLLVKKEFLIKANNIRNPINYYEDKQASYHFDARIFNLARKNFTNLKKNVIGLETSSYGDTKSLAREKFKKISLKIIKDNYSKNNFKYFIRENGQIDFDFIYDKVPKYVMFDGLDRSGKTTIKDLFKLYDNHFNLTTDRGLLSNIVYNEFFRGYKNHNEFFKMAESLAKVNVEYFVFICSYENYLKRKDNNNYTKKEFEEQKRLFIKYGNILCDKLKIYFIDGNDTIQNNLLKVQKIVYGVR